jgi:pimeloyl-[acyl-carrier protein] methyl ester esterase
MKLVLLPGLDGTGVLFRPFIAVLPPQIEPLVVPYPTQEPLGYDQLLQLALDAMPKHEPFVLLGESFGGPLSLRIAAQRPHNLRALVLAGSFIKCPFLSPPHWATSLIHPLPFRAFTPLTKLMTRFGLYDTPEHSALSVEAISQVAPEVFAHRVREIMRVDVTSELHACPVPLLYLQGEHDLVVPASNLKRILQVRSDVRVTRIASSHMILKTQPLAAVNAIKAFIDAECNS